MAERERLLLHLLSDDVVVDMTAFMRQRDQTGVISHILDCLWHVKVLAASADAHCKVEFPHE